MGLRLHRQETSHGAARRLYGILTHNSGTGLSSPGSIRPARFDGKLRTCGGLEARRGEWRPPSRKVASAKLWELKRGGASVKRGGPRGQAAAIPGSRDRKAGRPMSHRVLRSSRLTPLTLELCARMQRTVMRNHLKNNRIELQGGPRRSSLTTSPMGACDLRRRVFPSGFPHHVEDFEPSHNFARIPTACGAASAAAACRGS